MQQPVTNEKPNTIHRLTTPVQTSIARPSAAMPAATCVKSSNRRRSIKSANTPPRSVKINPGAVATNASRPSQKGELVKVRTSQPCATACIHVPTFERNAPIQKRRKLRCESARNIPLRRAVRGVISETISMGISRLAPPRGQRTATRVATNSHDLRDDRERHFFRTDRADIQS